MAELQLGLNDRALSLCQRLVDAAQAMRVRVHSTANGTRLIDCGVEATGGLQAGVALAEICLAGLADVRIVPADTEVWSGAAVQVATDHPVAACIAAQYAGWSVGDNDFFAMGSGPMRAVAASEDIFQQIGHTESADHVVGILEGSRLPPEGVCQNIASRCRVPSDRLTLLIAATSSLAGTVQIVARSVETALHKLHELGFDLRQVVSGYGTAPLPPVAAKALEGVGRTNDAILYGGQVTLWLRADDAQLEQILPRVPSCGSPDYGRPFLEIFQQYHGDFYAIDPHLFSPAVVRLVNLESGHSFIAGELRPDLIANSFGVRALGAKGL